MNDRRALPLVFLAAATLLAVAFCAPAGASAAVDPYLPAVESGVGADPVAVAAGDLNGDGKPDLVVANKSDDTISVLLGEGGGVFAPAVQYPVGLLPSSIAIGDLDGDGIPDLVVTNELSNDVSVFRGAGNGSFTFAGNSPVGLSPSSVAIADLDGDGIPDLVVTNAGSDTVSILHGRVGGTLAPAVELPVGAAPASVAVGDLNGDGIPDLAVANEDSNNVSILLGKEGGAFQSAADLAVGEGPRSIAIGALEEDNGPDLVTANSGSDNVSILGGHGNGTFAPAVDYAVGEEPLSVAVADLNGDPVPDLVVANAGAGSVSVLHGDLTGSRGTFDRVTETAVAGRPTAVAAADLNGDAVPDLAVVNSTGDAVQVLVAKPNPEITWHLNHPGQFGESVTGTISVEGGSAPTGSIVFSAYESPEPTYVCTRKVWTSGPVSVEGDGTYALPEALTPLAVGSYRIVAEYSGDAKNAPVTVSCGFEAPLIIINRVVPSFTVEAAPLEAGLGDPVTLTAEVADPGNGVRPSGEVLFLALGRVVGSAAIGADGIATTVTESLPVGVDQVDLQYGGDANYTLGVGRGPTVTVNAPPVAELFGLASGGGLRARYGSDGPFLLHRSAVRQTDRIVHRLQRPERERILRKPERDGEARHLDRGRIHLQRHRARRRWPGGDAVDHLHGPESGTDLDLAGPLFLRHRRGTDRRHRDLHRRPLARRLDRLHGLRARRPDLRRPAGLRIRAGADCRGSRIAVVRPRRSGHLPARRDLLRGRRQPGGGVRLRRCGRGGHGHRPPGRLGGWPGQPAGLAGDLTAGRHSVSARGAAEGQSHLQPRQAALPRSPGRPALDLPLGTRRTGDDLSLPPRPQSLHPLHLAADLSRPAAREARLHRPLDRLRRPGIAAANGPLHRRPAPIAPRPLGRDLRP